MLLESDPGIENLLYLDGMVLEVDSELGYFVQIKAALAEVTPGRPQGIKYSLTLHSKDNDRLMGFDNAHPMEDRRRGKFSRHRKLSKWDHKHRFKDVAVVTPYDYINAEKLLIDFWCAVDEAIELEKREVRYD